MAQKAYSIYYLAGRESRCAQGQREKDRLVWGASWVPGHCVKGSTHIRLFHPQIFLQREDLWSPILGKRGSVRLADSLKLSPALPTPVGLSGDGIAPKGHFGNPTGAFWGHGWHLEGVPGMRCLPCSGGRTAHVQHCRSYLSHNTAHMPDLHALWLRHHPVSLAWPHFSKR